jgi:hypothetical protein
LLVLLPGLPTAWGADLDADALIHQLAKPAPARIAFTEVRFSALLREPLVVSGQLGYCGPAKLRRHVTVPYREDTQIRGESVRVEREGESPRTFALKRAPQLRSLLAGFAALLEGDPVALRRSFDVEASGSDSSWTLTLTPLGAKTQQRLQRIEVNGRGDTPRCLSMHGDGDPDHSAGASIMLLGEAAHAGLPRNPTREALLKLCRAE